MNLVFLYFAVAFLTPAEQPREERIQELVREIANSGCVLEAGDRQARLADPRLHWPRVFRRCSASGTSRARTADGSANWT